jgi:hypothetical protein
MSYDYTTTEEFMDMYIKGELNEFNNELFGDYIDYNFYSCDLLNNNSVEMQYKNGCDCVNYTDDPCKCGNDINYWDDKFMWDKITMFPINMKLQKYYESIFPKRIFKNKIFYYLPNGCKYIYTTYIDKSLTDTFDIKRSISYKYINDELVLIEDCMSAWFGNMFNNFHTPKSKYFNKYITKLNEYQKNNLLIENDFNYGVKIISY